MYSRRRPSEDVPRIVSKADADAIDCEWRELNPVPGPELVPRLLSELAQLEQQRDLFGAAAAHTQLAQCFTWHDADRVEQHLRTAFDYHLLAMQAQGTPRVSVLAAHDCCSDCQAREGVCRTIAEERDQQSIPCRRCIDLTGWCSATYVPEPDQ